MWYYATSNKTHQINQLGNRWLGGSSISWTIHKSLQTHHHTFISSLNFLQPRCSSWRPNEQCHSTENRNQSLLYSFTTHRLVTQAMIEPQAAEYVSPSHSAESWAVRGRVVSTWETGCSWGPSDGLPSRSQSEHTNKCINYSHHQVRFISPAKTSSNNFVTFHVRRSQGKMYIDHGHRCVCLSVPRHIPTLLHGPGRNLGEW